jgi:PAS domain S-box-containing protein
VTQIAAGIEATFHPHDPLWVGISFVLAVFAAYVSLELADRIRVSTGPARHRWLAAAAVAMGGGIWSMHFLAIIGLLLPFPADFDMALTLVSLMVAVVLTAAGLSVAFWRSRGWVHYLCAGSLMGAGIAAMHYIGMEALIIPAPIAHDPAIAVLSVIVAIAAATTAVWLAVNTRRLPSRIASAVVMGGAVAGMHFTGIAAFICEYPPGVALKNAGESEPLLYLGVTTIALALLVSGLGLAYADKRARRVGQMTLAQFGINAIAAEDLDTVFFNALDLVRDMLRIDFALLKDLDMTGGVIRCLVTGANGLREIRMLDLDDLSDRSPVRRALDGAPVTYETLDPHSQAAFADLLAGRSIAAGVTVGNKVAGDAALVICTVCFDDRMFSDTDIAFLRGLVDLLAVFKSRDLAMRTVRLRDRALEAIAQGVIVTDEQGIGKRVIYANAAFMAMTNYPPEQILAPRPPAFIVAGSSPGLNERLALDAIKRRPTSFDCQIMRADRSTFTCRVTASPIVDTAGDLTHYVWVHEDVTESRRRDSQLRDMQRAETIGRLTGGVAHEFNNLLAVVRSNAEDIREDLKSVPLIHRQASLVVQAADRGAALIQQLLTYARKKETQTEIVDVEQVLAAFERLLRATVEADIEIETVTEEDLPAIKVDPAQFEEALLHLGLNARDAMPRGGRLIVETVCVHMDLDDVRQFHGLAPGAYLQIAVTDTGEGMTADVARRAFDPFFTTKDVGQGTGLGLSMVYGFTKQTGGDARIYSEAGHGTVVKLYIPVAASPAAGAEAADIFSDAKSGGRILLVEDNDLLRASVSGKLERLGYSVTAAPAGPQGVVALENSAPFDLVLTDIVMPGMSGADLAREVQRRWPRTKVLMTSGYSAAAVFGKVQVPHGIRVLPKPFTNAQLSEAVRATLAAPTPPVIFAPSRPN